jgi:hypothetical protein
MPAIARLPICSLCNEPVEIETAKTDENGDAVHGDCYVVKIRPKTSQLCHALRFPERTAISPMTLTCPCCGAKAGQVCGIFHGDLELVHVERMEAAAAMDTAARSDRG